MSDTAPALMLFDGVCVFCSRSVQFVVRRTDERLRFCAMQSPPGETLLRQLHMPLEDYQTLALIEGDKVLFKSDAVIRLGELMAPPWPSLARIARQIPQRIRNGAYDRIACNRYRLMGQQKVCTRADDTRTLT